MSSAIWVTSKLDPEQRAALEQLVFFNANQYRVRGGIEQSIKTYGAPEIYEHEGALRVRVGSVKDVQTLFAVNELWDGLSASRCSCGWSRLGFVVLHVVVEPRSDAASPALANSVLLRLMHEIRRAARITRGVDRIELVYKHAHSARAGKSNRI